MQGSPIEILLGYLKFGLVRYVVAIQDFGDRSERFQHAGGNSMSLGQN
jgi:hypothetical protein